MYGVRSRPLRWAALVCLALVVSLLAGPVVRADIYSDIQGKKQQQENIDAQAERVRGQLGIIAQNIKANEQALVGAEAELERARGKLATIADQLSKTEQQLKQVEKELVDVTAQLARRQKLLGARVRSLSEQGRMTYLDILFGSVSLANFFDRLEVLRLVVREDAVLFKDVRAAKAQVEESQRRVSDRKTQLLVLHQQQDRETKNIEQTRDRIKAATNQLTVDRQQYIGMLDDLEATSKRLESDIAELQAKANRKRIGKLALDFPVRPVRITDSYGMRDHPILGGQRMHWGTDFAADYGQNVLAAESGVVIQAGWNGAYGNSVIIDHGDGVATLYAHNSKLLVSEGDTVSKGQVLAYAGATGWATGPHVHLEVRVNGKAVDPMQYLPG